MRLGSRLLEDTLQFHFESGDVTEVVTGEVAQWRTMLCPNVAYFEGGEWLIEREDLGAFKVLSGEVSFVPAGVRHRSELMTPGTSESRWAHFSLLMGGYIDVFTVVQPDPVIRGPRAARLGELLSQLGQPAAVPEEMVGIMRRKMLEFEVAMLLVQDARPLEAGAARLRQLDRILPALDHIRSDLRLPHSRESLAARVHLSPSRFAALFKEAMGLAPLDYVLNQRLQRAESLLRHTDAKVEEIAAECGFDDPYYFSRMFRARLGHSPRNYRRLTSRE